MSLPAGYVDLGFMAIHIADLRKHTADIHRFQKYVGFALELEPTEPRSDEWLAVVERAGDAEALMETVRELFLLTASSLEELRQPQTKKSRPMH